jgi:subtilase family serine protease
MIVGMSTIFSISDQSMALVPTLMYSFSQNVDIYAYLNWNIGKEGTFFAKTMGNGGFVRVRIYF